MKIADLADASQTLAENWIKNRAALNYEGPRAINPRKTIGQSQSPI